MKFLRPWLPLVLSGVATLLLLKLGLISSLEPLAQHLLFQARGPQAWNEEIVLIKIDQASIDTLGWFPWQRDRYAQLLDRLTAAQAKTVAFNILFSEETTEDQAFAAAMANHGQVLLASTWHENLSPWMPNPTLAEEASSIGHITQLEKTSPPTVRSYIQGYPALAIAAAQTHHNHQGTLLLPNSDISLLPNWPGPIEQIHQYSFKEVLAQQFDPVAFKDKLVLVGMTAPGFDPLGTPFDPHPKASGVHLHAAIANSLLEQNFLRRPSQQGWILGFLSWGILLRYGLSRLNERKQLLSLLTAILSWPILGLIALKLNFLLPITLPITLFILSGITLLWLNYIQLNSLNHQLRSKATTDSLTQLRNRSFFNDYSAYIWRNGMRENHPISLILCDIDHFKQYNDTYGHLGGDECLAKVAHSLQQSIYRSSDLLARYGGEEFIILLPNTSLEHACKIAERIQTQLAEQALPHKSSSTGAFVTLSLGIASVRPTRESSFKMLIEQADQALYQAKQAGRNCFKIQKL